MMELLKESELELEIQDLDREFTESETLFDEEQVLATPTAQPAPKLKQNPRNGMLILDGKGELPKDCIGILDRLFDHTAKINPIHKLSPDILASILEEINSPKGGESGNSKHFSTSARTGIFNAAVLLEVFGHHKILHYNLSGLQTVLDQIFSSDANENDKLVEMLDLLPFDAKMDDMHMGAVRYFIQQTMKSGEEKQSVKSSIDAWIAPFFQNKLIRHWTECVESEINLIDILNGARFGLLLPKSQFPITGRVMTTILKRKLYMAIEERGSNWRDKGMSQVFLIVDEAQEIADEADLTIIPMARSWGLSVIFATQNIESYVAKHGKDRTMQMMDSLGSIICLKSSSDTYDYIKNRIGKDRIWFEALRSQSLAFSTTMKIAMSNPLINPTHPMAHILKFLKVGGIRKMFSKLSLSGLADGHKRNNYASLQLSAEPMYIIQEKEIQVVQNTKFAAIAVLQRGGAPRRDVIILDPKDSNFNSIANTAEKLMAKDEVDFGEVL